MEATPTPDLLATARALATDAACATVVSAWREEGIQSILLKGATLVEWLYPDEVRAYGDADLLIEAGRVMDAASVLARLGFQPVAHHVSLHAHPWVRTSDGAHIDMHVTLWGLRYPADRVWREFDRCTQVRRIASVPVRTLNMPGRALHVVLHAAQHVDIGKPQEDLRRALARTPEPIWHDASRLADRVGALQTMAEGLALDPDGRRLIDALPLVRAATLDAQHAPLAIGLARYSLARGPREKLAVVVASLARPPEDLTSEPGGGAAQRLGPPAARLWHFLSLLGRAPRTILAVRRMRRGSEKQ